MLPSQRMSTSRFFIPIIVALSFLAGCDDEKPEEKPEPINRDLPAILRSEELVVLTESSSISYYLFRGKPMGFDYEIMQAFAEYLGVKLKVKVIPDLNDMFAMLWRGEGDIIACNLTITPERESFLRFSRAIDYTGAVLVQNVSTPDSLFIHDITQINKTSIMVHEFSVFKNIMDGLQSEGAQLVPAPGHLDSEELIRMVAKGEILATISDENVAVINKNYYANLDIQLHLSPDKPIGFAMRPNASDLAAALDNWISDASTERKLNFFRKKYFESGREQSDRVLSEFSSLGGNQISPWDNTIKAAAEGIHWDWRLLAALIYHESRFNPEAHSYAGAFGLMQLMPETGRKLGIDTTDKTDANILAGGRYIKSLDRFWTKHIADSAERVKFILASYNVGPGHILDAMVIAEHLCLSRDIWFENVEHGLNLKSNRLYYELNGVKNGYCRGYSATEFVRNVLGTFEHYKIYQP
jgi:membrane-bound lytic murein transglycosylase F